MLRVSKMITDWVSRSTGRFSLVESPPQAEVAWFKSVPGWKNLTGGTLKVSLRDGGEIEVDMDTLTVRPRSGHGGQRVHMTNGERRQLAAYLLTEGRLELPTSGSWKEKILHKIVHNGSMTDDQIGTTGYPGSQAKYRRQLVLDGWLQEDGWGLANSGRRAKKWGLTAEAKRYFHPAGR